MSLKLTQRMPRIASDLPCADSILNNRNYNLYAGEPEYKLSKFLTFLSQATVLRFLVDNYIRYKLIRKALIYIKLSMLIILFFFIEMKILIILILIHLTLIKIKTRMMTRLIYYIEQFICIISIGKYLSKISYALLVLLIEDFALNITHLIPWFFNFLSHTLFVILPTIIYWKNIEFDNCYFLMVISSIGCSIFYGFVERIIKENWVLFDSFKKSERIYTSLFHKNQKILIVNEKSIILFGSTEAFEFLSVKPVIPGITDLASYVHYQNVKDLIKAITNTSKTSRQGKIKVLIYQDYPDDKKKNTELDIILEITKNKAMYCKLKLSVIQWKNNRNKVYIEIKNQTKKILKKELLKKFGMKYSLKFIKGQNYIYELLPENMNSKKAMTNLLFSDSLIAHLIYNHYNENVSSFAFKNLMSLVIDLCTKSAVKRKNELTTQFDNSFPVEITCDIRLLELFLVIFIKFFICHCSESTINVSYSLIDTTSEDFVTCIKISSPKLEPTAINFLDMIISYPFDFNQMIKEFLEHQDFKLIIGQRIVKSFFKGLLTFNKFNNPFILIIEVHFLRTIDYNNLIKISNKTCSLSENRKSVHLADIQKSKSSNKGIDKLMKFGSINYQSENPNKTTAIKTPICNTINIESGNKEYRLSAMKKLINEELKISQNKQQNDLILINKKIQLSKLQIIEENSKGNKFLTVNNLTPMVLSHSLVIEESKSNMNSSNKLEIPSSHPLKILNSYCKQKSVMTIEINKNSEKIIPPLITFGESKGSNPPMPEMKQQVNRKDERENEENEGNKELDKEMVISFLEMDESNNDSKKIEVNHPKIQAQFREATRNKNFDKIVGSEGNISPVPKSVVYNSQQKSIISCNIKSNNAFDISTDLKYIQLQDSQSFQQSLTFLHFAKKFTKIVQVIKIHKRRETTIDINCPEVLVVEDNLFQLNVVINMLNTHKIKYDVAQNGTVAVDSYKRKIKKEDKLYTLILMDLWMPVKSGYDATKEIREIETEERCKKTFICGMSSDKSQVVENKCRECGMDHFLTKPINISVLKNLIAEVHRKNNEENQSGNN